MYHLTLSSLLSCSNPAAVIGGFRFSLFSRTDLLLARHTVSTVSAKLRCGLLHHVRSSLCKVVSKGSILNQMFEQIVELIVGVVRLRLWLCFVSRVVNKRHAESNPSSNFRVVGRRRVLSEFQGRLSSRLEIHKIQFVIRITIRVEKIAQLNFGLACGDLLVACLVGSVVLVEDREFVAFEVPIALSTFRPSRRVHKCIDDVFVLDEVLTYLK